MFNTLKQIDYVLVAIAVALFGIPSLAGYLVHVALTQAI